MTIKKRSLAWERIGLDKGYKTLENLGNELVRGRAEHKPPKAWEQDWLV